MPLVDDIFAASSFDAAIRTAVAGVQRHRAQYDWVGVYLYDGQALTLRTGHYQGLPTSETELTLDQGICGAAAANRETIIVDDVRQDERYIACSLAVESEIVVPIMAGEALVGVLDLDSDTYAAFGADDQQYLESVATALGAAWQKHGSPGLGG
ncbi:MAG: GAF domain-containing protein [Candidatus Marinimicrobia bacterium]|nr:GAF domain-containing protein [Candidatus Neomarinimicrobiota bacterium]